MRLAVQACTRASARHEVNEDRATVGHDVLALTSNTERRRLGSPAMVAVLDGVGGAPAGDVASDLAAKAIAAADPPTTAQDAAGLLERTDQLLLDAGQVQIRRSGMATTAALLVLLDDDGQALVANVGDSQVARLAPGGMHELSSSDRIGRAIYQALGGPPEQSMTPHVTGVQLAVGDRLLLATDGLTDVVSPDRIAAMLGDGQSDPAASLLDAVEQAGLPDDVTILIVDVEAD